MDKYMDKYRKIIKSLIKKQEKKLEKLNQREFDRSRICFKADYLDGGTFKATSINEDLKLKTDLEKEDDK